MGKASTRAQNKYIQKAYDRINLTVPKGRQADIKAYADERGESVNGYINGLIRADMGMTEEEWKKADIPAGEPVVPEEVYEQAQAAMKRRNKGTEKKDAQ